jgi:hypothetical protein
MVSGSIIAGAAIGGAILGGKEQKKAGKKSKRLAFQQAEQERLELEESLRRLDIKQDQLIGRQRAGAGATGLNIRTGTIREFLDSQQEEMRKVREFEESQGRRRIELIKEGGEQARDQAKAQARLGFIEAGQTAITQGASAFQTSQSNPDLKWWQL